MLQTYRGGDDDGRHASQLRVTAAQQTRAAEQALVSHAARIAPEEQLLVLALTGRDGELIGALLATAGIASHMCDIPSMPGYAFSGKPTGTGWDPGRIATAWVSLMRRLGYTKFVAQGGDWGELVSELMGKQAPAEPLLRSSAPASARCASASWRVR